MAAVVRLHWSCFHPRLGEGHSSFFTVVDCTTFARLLLRELHAVLVAAAVMYCCDVIACVGAAAAEAFREQLPCSLKVDYSMH